MRLLRRWLRLLLLVLRSGRRRLVAAVRGIGAGPERKTELAAELHRGVGEDAAAVLGSMRGVFMKLGQLVSFVDEGLAPELRAALATLQDSAPPMPASQVTAAVAAALGAPPEDVFAAWEPDPVAAASIGQVHRARLRDGRDVAVKVQYPGAAATMRSDLAQLDLAGMAPTFLWRQLDVDAIAEELKARLLEELDYSLEASHQRDFAAWYRGHPFIHVPGVVEELSTSTVLTTDFVDGARFAALDGWSQRERDLAGEAIFRFVYRSMCCHRAFNADPHPGNYLFHGDGRVSFLDFGLTKRLTEDQRDHQVAMLLAAGRGDRAVRDASVAAGYFPEDCPLTDEQIASFVSLLFQHVAAGPERGPAPDEPFTITPEHASTMVRTYLVKGQELKHINRWGRIPPEVAVLERINIGLLAVLGRLRATACWRGIVEELVADRPPVSELGEREAAWLARAD